MIAETPFLGGFGLGFGGLGLGLGGLAFGGLGLGFGGFGFGLDLGGVGLVGLGEVGLGLTGAFMVVGLPLIVDVTTLADVGFSVLAFGDMLVTVDLNVVGLPLDVLTMMSVLTIFLGACGYTSVTIDATEVA